MVRYAVLILVFLFNFLVFNSNVHASENNKAFLKPIIVLDAGHGGLHKGARIKDPFVEEKKLTLTTTLLAKKYLEKHGYKVVLTRDKDYFVPLKKRVDRANNSKADLFVSIHFNSCPNKIAKGVEIYFHNSKENLSKAKNSKKLAHCVLSNVIKKTKAESRGVRKGQFIVVKETKMPAILIEAGFLTNPQERDMIRNSIYLEKISQGIADGIETFMKKYI